MVGTLVGLQLKLFVRSVRGNVGKIIALVMGGLWIAGGTLAALVGLIVLRGQPTHLTGSIITLGFSMLTAGWPFVTLLVTGVDQTLDPGRFALFPLRAKQLQPGLLLAGLTGMGGVATVVLALGTVVSWSSSALLAVAALVTAVLGVLTCVLVSRWLTSAFSEALSSRRFRDVAAVMLGLIGILFGIGAQFISRVIGQDPMQMAHRISGIAGVLSWTPLGWAWSVPWRLSQGDWVGAVLRLVLAAALVALLWKRWEVSLDKALVSPLEQGGEATKVKASSVVDQLMPATVAGAIGARSLRYWRRDPRHVVMFVVMVAMPFLMVAPMLIQPEIRSSMSPQALLFYPVGGVLLLTAVSVAAEINYDGPALWMSITAGVTGRDDRLGRMLALLVLEVPMALVIGVVFLMISKQGQLAPSLFGATLGALLASSAVGCVVGAIWQYPVPPPGANAFARSSGGGMTGLLSSLVNMGGSLVVSAPFLVTAVMARWTPWLGWLSLALALVLGPLLLWGGIVLGGRILDRRWPEVLAMISVEKN